VQRQRWIDKRVDTGEKKITTGKKTKVHPYSPHWTKNFRHWKNNFLPLKEAPKKISKQLQLSPKMTPKSLNQN